jgi:sphinganine C4-monooxygenase
MSTLPTGLILDSAGGALSHACALMTVRQGILLFAFSTLKTVSDHGGYAFPMWLDPLHLLFPNTSEFHDVHHQMQGLKYNYSQPFFVHFDILFGTRMSAAKFQKMREVNKKFKLTGAAQTTQEISAKEEINGSATSDLRLRNQASAKQDQSPEEIVLQSHGTDPTVTLDAESYRAKAGTTT